MRVLRLGFTLSEALVAMAIIGIIATMTIPQVIQNTLKNQAGAVLGRTVEQIETGCQNMIQKANDNITVYDGGYYDGLAGLTTKEVFGSGNKKLSGPGLFDNGSSFFGLTPIEDSATYIASLKDFSGNTLNASVQPLNSTKVYSLNKQKAIVFLSNNDASVSEFNDFNTAIYIDVNGIAKPNRGGKDVFIFGLTNQGKLIPRGTKLYQQKYYSGAPLYENDCKEGNVKTGWSCAAKVVKDGYRITY